MTVRDAMQMMYDAAKGGARLTEVEAPLLAAGLNRLRVVMLVQEAIGAKHLRMDRKTLKIHALNPVPR